MERKSNRHPDLKGRHPVAFGRSGHNLIHRKLRDRDSKVIKVSEVILYVHVYVLLCMYVCVCAAHVHYGLGTWLYDIAKEEVTDQGGTVIPTSKLSP